MALFWALSAIDLDFNRFSVYGAEVAMPIDLIFET